MQYVKQLNKINMSLRILIIHSAANYLLLQGHSNHSLLPTISPLWVFCFIKCHPELFKRKQMPIAVKRANAEDSISLGLHFDSYNAVQVEKGIQDADTWNMDETGFRIGCGRGH